MSGQNQSMFPGEDGIPLPPEMPLLPPGMVRTINAQTTGAAIPSGQPAWPNGPLYMPPERCQTKKGGPDPAFPDPAFPDPALDLFDLHDAQVRMGSTPTPYLGLTTDAAERKRLPLWTFLVEYFPDAFLAVLDVSVKGNDQHNPGQKLHWARAKSTDQMNTAFRHMWDYGRGVKKDTDGAWHLAKAIWRLSAQLQLEIEQNGETR